MIKRFFLAAILLCSVLVFSKSDGGVVSSVLGLNVDCGDACQPIPLNVTVLCNNAGCPLQTAPSFTDEQRFWGSSGAACRTGLHGQIVLHNRLIAVERNNMLEHRTVR
jgi:hypothetical protein